MNKYILLAAVIGAAYAVPTVKVTGILSSTLESQKTANIFVSFVGSNTKAIKVIERQSFKTRGERLNALGSSLKAHRDASQENVQNFLKESNIIFESFWISNQIFIKGASKDIIESLVSFPEIEIIDQEPIFTLDSPISSKDVPAVINPSAWGVNLIQAPEAWAITNGSGVVVANIDGGVRATHEILRYNFRTDGYGWHDPYQRTDSPVPDPHGTHTMGNLAGGKGIGVAPGSIWMACRGCNGRACSGGQLVNCGEWLLCPTKLDGSGEDCSKAPVVIGNSWGGGGPGNTFYESVANAWIAGGIVPVFSQGNQVNAECGSLKSPGDMRQVIAVGATDIDDAIATYSGRGPSLDGRIKPEISAPGKDVYSAGFENDTHYRLSNGTSMAAPHVAGVCALALSVNPNLSVEQVKEILFEGTDRNLTTTNDECGGRQDNQFPNNHFGHGRVNALKVVQLAQALLKK